MKKLIKKLLKIVLVLLVISGIGAGGYYGYQWYSMQQLIKQRPKEVLAKDGTNINPAWYSLSTYNEQLRKKYPFINKVSNYVSSRTWDGKNAVVPGLEATKSYNFSNKKYDTATKMTPQGITVAGKYILITAYDGAHEHASVIYALDKKTGKYLKTMQVSGRPHLGGIAYDPKGENVWITGSIGKSSALMSFPLSSVTNYNQKLHEPIVYNHKVPIPALQRASALTYYDDQLFVGYFNLDGRGRVASYTFSRRGKNKNSIANNEIKTVTGSVAWSDPSGETSMDKQIQGIAIYDNKIFLSQSYGSKDSKLYIFPSTALDELDEKNAEIVINMPPYLEQITAYKGQLLCIFESGAQQYARADIMIMDRVLSVNINALFGS